MADKAHDKAIEVLLDEKKKLSASERIQKKR